MHRLMHRAIDSCAQTAPSSPLLSKPSHLVAMHQLNFLHTFYS
jgi:hypothetical protein